MYQGKKDPLWKARILGHSCQGTSHKQVSSSCMQKLQAVYLCSQANMSPFSWASYLFRLWSVFFHAAGQKGLNSGIPMQEVHRNQLFKLISVMDGMCLAAPDTYCNLFSFRVYIQVLYAQRQFPLHLQKKDCHLSLMLN